MPPTAHARLSPSAAERWLNCPASVRMEALLGGTAQSESPYALEGTAAHALAELFATQKIVKPAHGHTFNAAIRRWRDTHTVDEEQHVEMRGHVEAYVRFLQERLYAYDDATLMLEQRMPTGVPDCWGTSDAVIASPRHVEIVDFKYGQGVRVDAEMNPQIMLYGVAALEMYGDVLGETEVVHMSIYQPRLNHISSFSMSPQELRDWRDNVVIPTAALTQTDDAPFGPSETACRWCAASGQCAAQLRVVAETDFGTDVDLLDDTELARALEQTKLIKVWLQAVEAVAMNRAYDQGKALPGWKVILSGGRRFISDQDGAIAALRERGLAVEEFTRLDMKGIGELEKLAKGAGFTYADLFGAFTSKTDGKPSLVPESNKTPAFDKNAEAAKDFDDE